MFEKTLFAGPFIGEFGMELFTWQGHIRKMAEKFDKTIKGKEPRVKKNKPSINEREIEDFLFKTVFGVQSINDIGKSF